MCVKEEEEEKEAHRILRKSLSRILIFYFEVVV